MKERQAADFADSKSLLLLATRAADEGRYDQVPELFLAARKAERVLEERQRWYLLLVESGAFELARELEPRMTESSCSNDTQLVGEHPSNELPGEEDFLDFEPGERVDPAVTDPRASLVAAFLARFRGRGDVYARQWFDARRDRGGYWPVREALTPAVALDHLNGRITIGQYVLHPDETVGFAVLDLDPTAAEIERSRLDSGERAGARYGPLAQYAIRLTRAGKAAELSLFVEETGGAGLHLWLFFEPRIPARDAQALLRELLVRAGPQPVGVALEVFPKQERLTGKGLGNLVKLPLGVHQATLRRSVFLDDDLEAIPDADALAKIRPCNPEAIHKLLAGRVVPLARHEAPTAPPQPSPPRDPPALGLESPARRFARALADIPAGEATSRALDCVVERCAVVRELMRRALEGEHLTAAEARALVYTVGLLGRDNPRVDEAFARAGLARKELDRARRGLPTPTGCRRLKELLPHEAQSCACPEDGPLGYASPASFALASSPPRKSVPPSWDSVAEFVARADDQGAEGSATRDGAPSLEPSALEQRLAAIEAALQTLLSARSQREGS